MIDAGDRVERFSGFGACEMSRVVGETRRRRFYALAVMPGLFSVILQRRWGRFGSKPRVKDEDYVDLQVAVARANEIYRAKVRKGYEELGSEP